VEIGNTIPVVTHKMLVLSEKRLLPKSSRSNACDS